MMKFHFIMIALNPANCLGWYTYQVGTCDVASGDVRTVELRTLRARERRTDTEGFRVQCESLLLISLWLNSYNTIIPDNSLTYCLPPSSRCSNTFLYMKFLILWAIVIIADFMLEFRFEFLWPFWLLLRSVHDSFKYKGLVSGSGWVGGRMFLEDDSLAHQYNQLMPDCSSFSSPFPRRHSRFCSCA